MLRAAIELLITIIAVVLARAILSSVLKSVTNYSRGAFQNQSQQGGAGTNPGRNEQAQAPAASAGELHKDPVCGTYVAESAAVKKQIGGQTFYYCSEDCRNKHALVSR